MSGDYNPRMTVLSQRGLESDAAVASRENALIRRRAAARPSANAR